MRFEIVSKMHSNGAPPGFSPLAAGPVEKYVYGRSEYELLFTGPDMRERLAPPPMGFCDCFLREASTKRTEPRDGQDYRTLVERETWSANLSHNNMF